MKTPPHDIIDRLFPACVTIGTIGAIVLIGIAGFVRNIAVLLG